MQDLGGIPGSSGSSSTGESTARVAEDSRSLSRDNVVDLVLFLSLVGLSWLERIATLDAVDPGGDVVNKWEFVRQWFFSNSFRHVHWVHHMARFGVNVPAYFAQLLGGHGLAAYYVVPIGASLVQVAFVFACGKRLSGRLAGVLGALLLIHSGAMATAGSQLLPDLFTGTYGIVATYLYLRYADAEGKERTLWLISSAVVCFVGYLAKETMVFFFPGFLLAIWLAERRPAPVAVFCIVLASGFVLESLGFRLFTDYPSRLAIVRSSHGGDGIPTTTFMNLFERYRHVDATMARAIYCFFPCFFGVLALKRDFRNRGVLAITASFFFFLTFLVRGLNPMLLWHRFMSRYFDPVLPFMHLAIGIFFALALTLLWEEIKDLPLLRRLEPRDLPVYGAALTVVVCSLYAWSSYSQIKTDFETRVHPFKANPAIAFVANDTYRRNLPIYTRENPRIDKEYYDRDLHTLYGVFMDVNLLVRNGRLPPFDEAKRVLNSYTYVLRDPLAYSDAQIISMIRASCALEIKERSNQYMGASPMTKLPSSCDELAARR